MDLQKFEHFLKRLNKEQRIIVQAHDFPDHDAISSAFAMAYLLRKQGFKPFITYRGFIDRISLKNLINWLEIPLVKSDKLALTPNDKIIIVDGCIGEKNITDLPGLEVAVIDHHQIEAPSFVWYSDIRTGYGATATIMVEYFNYFGLDIPERIATALLVGLMFDTAHFTRAVSASDMNALTFLQSRADMVMVNKICRNQLEIPDLAFFNSMLDSMRKDKNSVFAVLPEGCPKNMLGILGDFMLSVNEVDLVVLSTRDKEKTFISLRSECQNNNMAQV